MNSLPIVYDGQNNPMGEEHQAKRKKSRWWPTSWGAMRIFAALIAVGALLFVFRDYYPEKLRDRPLAVLGAAVVVAAVVVLIRVGQHYQWTGFGESVRPKADNQEIQPRKTLWDWLQLFIVPLALAAIGLWFSAQQDAHQQHIEDKRAKSDRLIEDKRAKSDRLIEEQRAQDAALQAYLDQMSQLMLEGNLLKSKESNEVRTLARARTQTVLGRLDSRRKGSVVQFLYEASLINKENPLVSLSDVRLSGANLSHLVLSDANLSDANLMGAILSDANLSDANLERVDLEGAVLSDAILSDANLSDAQLEGADLSLAILPGADLSRAYLSDANLSDAILSEAKLEGADLSLANLRKAELNDANLKGAYLLDADVRRAELNDANLKGADLRGADLRGASLREAEGVTQEQLEKQAEALEGATMPDGSIHY